MKGSRMMKTLAIIPARCGSKGLKDKNIKMLIDKPLIAYSIISAQESGVFDEIMVSTDSQEYAEIAMKWGAEVPFIRNSKTATDEASSKDVILEVLDNYADQGKIFDSFCLLQPTSPLRTGEDIIRAYDLFCRKATFAVVSVCETEHSPLWCGHLPESGEFIDFVDKNSLKQRQAGTPFYRINGAIYFVNTEKYRNDSYFYQRGSYAYIMPQSRSIDIDTELDFKMAELLIRVNNDI